MDTTLENKENHEFEKISSEEIEKIRAYFDKKSDKMRALLKAHPIPKEFLKRSSDSSLT